LPRCPTTRAARERILQYLRLHAGAEGRAIAIEGQLQDIAGEIGMTREALYRTLAALEAEGSLSRSESEILLKKSALGDPNGDRRVIRSIRPATISG
jgi:DNA-binding IclR family transcriptional regulator